jgi:DNA-binding GntR family transcriptional regulator
MSKAQRIADDLRQQIIDGDLPPGTRLPTLKELRNRYHVAENTVFNATQLLIGEGLISGKAGAGYYVRPRPTVIRMVRSWYRDAAGKGSPWRADMATQGRNGSWEWQSKPTTATPAVAERLHIAAGDRVMRTAYTFTADGEAVFLSTSWEPMALTLGTEILLPEEGVHAGKGVADRMAVIGHAPTRVDEEIVPRTLTDAEAAKLKLHAGISIVVIQRTYYDGDLPLETADIVLPPHYRAVYQIPVG